MAALIAAAAGDAATLLKLAIELNGAVVARDATIAEMRSADESRRAKQAERTRRSRNATQRDDTLRDVTARDVTTPLPPSPPLLPPTPPNNSSSAPHPSSSSSPAGDGESNDAPADVTRLLCVLPGGASRTAWEAELAAAKQGMHSPPLTDEQIARACRDYLGNGHTTRPSLRHFRAFLASAAKTSSERAITAASGGSEAGKHFAKIRELIQQAPRVPGQASRRFIRRADVEALGDRALRAYDEIGGADRFLDSDEKVGFVLRDFTRAYGTLTGATP